MSAGHLTATATLFMRGAIYPQRTSAGEVQLLFPLLERRDMGTQKIIALWTGPQADAFFKTHGATIKAGHALQFEFERLFCLNNELHGVVATAALAPARWADKPAGETPAQPVPEPQKHAPDKYEHGKAGYAGPVYKPGPIPLEQSAGPYANASEAITCSADARQ